MYCKNCGTKLDENCRFCFNCGTKIETNQNPQEDNNKTENNQTPSNNLQISKPNQEEQQTKNENQTSNNNTEFEKYNSHWNNTSNMQANSNNTKDTIIKIFCSISCIYLFFYFIHDFFNILDIANSLYLEPEYYYLLALFSYVIICILHSFSIIALFLTIFLIGFKRTKQNACELFSCFFISIIIKSITTILLPMILFASIEDNFLLFFMPILTISYLSAYIIPNIILTAIYILILYILIYKTGDLPPFSQFIKNINLYLKNACQSLKLLTENYINKNNLNKNTSFNQNSNFNYNNQSEQTNMNFNPFIRPLRCNRNIIIFIILNFVTCFIYFLYSIYEMARDINTICKNDNCRTSGLIMFIFLTLITCGIYPFYWFFTANKRLATNAPIYGVYLKDSSLSVFLWLLIAPFTFGIGSFVAIYITYENLNILSAAYNHKNFN